jgi:tetratricopeptide (TPR) repeat protein
LKSILEKISSGKTDKHTSALLNASKLRIYLELLKESIAKRSEEDILRFSSNCLSENLEIVYNDLQKDIKFQVFSSLCIWYLKENVPDKALIVNTKALELKPRHLVVRICTSSKYFVKLFVMRFNSYQGSLLNKGHILTVTKKYHLAIAAYNMSLEMEPESVQALLAISDALLKLGNLDNALKFSLKASSVSPNDTAALLQISLIQLLMGDLEIAETTCRRLLLADINHELGRLLLSVIKIENARVCHSYTLARSHLLDAEEDIHAYLHFHPGKIFAVSIVKLIRENLYMLETFSTADISDSLVGDVISNISQIVIVFPYTELRVPGPYPDVIDSTRREQYLSDKEFIEIIKVDKETFQNFPKWRQIAIKKGTGLF